MTASSTGTPSQLAPSVLVVLVVRDAAGWLRGCLSALGAQTYPRMGVVAVDNASRDGSRELLTQALGERRVITSELDRGLAGSVGAALEIPAAREADYLLVLHDDTALDPDAVTRLVEAAIGMRVENVGVVGPKVVDWDEPRLLRDVGRSADRFGHAYTPLQPGEIDQGQFDRVIEVLCVPTCAMLIARDAWQRAGLFDERLNTRHEDLDFCWRARLAGFHVLMTPLARARHRDASAVGERPPARQRRTERYYEERAANVAMLKNYSLPSLLWLLPVAILIGLLRLAYLVLTRRFDESLDLLAAWGWNIVHLPGTISRRVRAQSVRKVPDHQLRRFMESAGVRLPRWFAAAGQILEEQREVEDEDEDATVGRRLRDRTASLVGTHPVVVASFLGAVVAAIAFRSFLGPEALHGGALPAFPGSWSGFFSELTSGYRTTGLGGTLAASPALGAMGAVSWIAFGSTTVAQKVLLAGGPILASIMLYRALARITGRPGAAVLGAVSYGLSATVLWAFSEGRIALLVALCVLPGHPRTARGRVRAGGAPRRTLEVHRRSGRHVRGRHGVHAGRGARGRGARHRAGPVRFLTPSRVGDRGRGVRRGRGAPLPVRAHHPGRRRRRPRLPHRHHGPRGAGPARGRRRAGNVVDRRVPADRRSAGVLARRSRAPRDREPDGGRGDRRPRARVGVIGRLPPRVGGERPRLPRARRRRRGSDRRPGPVVRAIGSRA